MPPLPLRSLGASWDPWLIFSTTGSNSSTGGPATTVSKSSAVGSGCDTGPAVGSRCYLRGHPWIGAAVVVAHLMRWRVAEAVSLPWLGCWVLFLVMIRRARLVIFPGACCALLR